MKINFISVALVSGLIISLLGCAALAYLWIDRSITLSYVNQSLDASIDAGRHLNFLLMDEWIGMPENKILQKLTLNASHHPEEKILIKKDGDNVIWYGQIRFEFEVGQLKKITP